MKNLFLFLSCALLLAIASCNVSEDITCGNGLLSIAATGFTGTDLDSAMVVRYKQDNTLGIVIDSAKVVELLNSGDTSAIVPHFIDHKPDSSISSASYFPPGYDYKIFLPTLGRWYSITGITLAGNTHQHITHQRGNLLHYTCTNSVTSCSINGAVVPAQHTASAMDQLTQVFISK